MAFAERVVPLARSGGRNTARWVAFVLALSACRRAPPTEKPPAEMVRASPERPKELLAEGVLRHAGEVWDKVRAVAGGRAMLLPSAWPLTVTTVTGLSPLVAGLLDAASPVVVSIVQTESAGVVLVAGLRVSSGAELLAALSNGADAAFAADPDDKRGLTLLRPRKPGTGPVLAVVDDVLLAAPSDAPLRIAAPYMARSLLPKISEGDDFELTIEKATLGGPVAAAFDRLLTEQLSELRAADTQMREKHGGRAPDFGDPNAVLSALSNLTRETLGIVKSTSEARLTVRLRDPILRVHFVATPEPTGPARSLFDGFEEGDLSFLGGLPLATGAAVAWRRTVSDGAATETRARALFGDHLNDADGKRLLRWTEDADRAMGSAAALGVFGAVNHPGVFVLSPSGDPEALCRATRGLVDVFSVPAIAKPFAEFVGPSRAAVVPGGALAGASVFSRVRVRSSRPVAASAPEFEAACAGENGRAAVTVAITGVPTPLADLVRPEGSERVLAEDSVVKDAMNGTARRAAYAGLLQVHEASGVSGFSALVIGHDGAGVWAELTAGQIAARVLAGALME